MNTATQQFTLYTDKRGFVVLLCISILLFSLYIYFISASIVHVVIRTEISQDITMLSSEISSLESSYIEAQHKVSSDIATLQGYEETPKKVFINRNPDSLVLRTQNQN